MAFVVADRVKETTTTTGTGAVALAGAVTGFRTFASGIGNSNTTYYTIASQTANEWEVGYGTLDATSANLARTTVFASSNGGSLVTFSAGTKDVFVTQSAARTLVQASGGTTTNGVLYYTGSGVATGGSALTFDGSTFNTTGNITLNGSQVLAASNYNSYAPTLTGTGASGTWGISITGNAATTSQTNFSNLTIGSSQVLYAGNYNSYAPTLTGTGASGTWAINVTGSAGSAGSSTTSTYVTSQDIRTLSPSSTTAARMGFGFTSWANNNSAPYADYLAMRSYTDSSGGNDNLLMLNKSSIAMRVYQQAWGSSSAYSTYADVLMSNNYNSYAPTLTGTGASGTWSINVTGYAGSLYGAAGTIQSTTTGTSYSNAYQVREALGGSGNSSSIYTPRLAWHWSGIVASSIGMESSGRIAIFNNPGTSYENLVCNQFQSDRTYGLTDIRSPIFYDYDNTAYYVNPNGTSVLYNAVLTGNAGGLVVLNGNPADTINAATWYGIGGSNVLGYGSYSYMVQVAGYYGLRLRSVSTILDIDGLSYGSGWAYVNTNFAVAGQIRAPIFYDSDNTGYYVNPNSLTYCNVITADRFYTGYDSGVNNSFSCSAWFRSSGNTGWYNATYGGGIYMEDSTWVRVYASKGFLAENTIQFQTTGGVAEAFKAVNSTSTLTNQSIIRFSKTTAVTSTFGSFYGGMLDWTQVKPDGGTTNTAQIYARNTLFGGINNTIASGNLYFQANSVNTSNVEFTSVKMSLLGSYSSTGSFNLSGYDSALAADTDWYRLVPTSLRPSTDNYASLGVSSFRWTVVYATTGTINTSDRTQKDEIRDLEAAEKAVAVRIKSLFKAFKFKEAIQKKGDGARIHVGVIAQDVQDAFIAEGLDPNRYALFCSDTFKVVGDVPAERDDLTNEYPADAVDKTILGVRYDELLAFVISAI